MQAAGRTARTIRLHMFYINGFRRLQPAPIRIRTEELEVALSNPVWAPETRKSARSVARCFFGFAHERGYLPRNPALDLLPVKVPHPIARPAADKDIRTALRNAPEREALMIRFAAYCGLRACEIARVHARDWDGVGLLHVHGKGRRARVVPVVDPVLKMALNQATGYIFPGRLEGHLSPAYVTRRVSQFLPDGITCHMLRHRLATRAYAGTRDLLAVQELLGHSKPETTRRYIQLPADAMTNAVAAAAQLSA